MHVRSLALPRFRCLRHETTHLISNWKTYYPHAKLSSSSPALPCRLHAHRPIHKTTDWLSWLKLIFSRPQLMITHNVESYTKKRSLKTSDFVRYLPHLILFSIRKGWKKRVARIVPRHAIRSWTTYGVDYLFDTGDEVHVATLLNFNKAPPPSSLLYYTTLMRDGRGGGNLGKGERKVNKMNLSSSRTLPFLACYVD